MKKLFTILALVLTVALCASFAVSAETLTAETYTELGEYTNPVIVDRTPATDDTDTVVYSVDVAWTGLEFTYSAGTEKWDPTEHDYSDSNDDADWGNTNGSITVTNHSNAAVAVTVAYADATNGDVDVSLTNGTFELESAVGKAVGAAATETATLAVDTETSTAPAADATVGTVTVTIAAPITES